MMQPTITILPLLEEAKLFAFPCGETECLLNAEASLSIKFPDLADEYLMPICLDHATRIKIFLEDN